MNRNVFFLLLGLMFLTSCEKYSSGSFPTLSGKYVINRVSINSKNSPEKGDSTYKIGDTFLDTSKSTPFPFDKIQVGSTKIHFDNIVVNLRYIGQGPVGSDMWDKSYETWYQIWFNTPWQEGYLKFTYYDSLKTKTNHTCIFRIEDDSFESLELISNGNWPSSKYGDRILTLYLNRIGP